MQEEITSENMLPSDLVDDTNQTNKFVTESDKTNWNAKVGRTDYASSSKGGVIKASSNYGLLVNSSGELYARSYSASTLSSLGTPDTTFIGKKTLQNYLTYKNYQSAIDSENKLDADLVDDTTSTNKFVSSSDKTNWNAKENSSNKVTSISSSSTDTQYPSAKCVYDLVGNIESILETLDVGGGTE